MVSLRRGRLLAIRAVPGGAAEQKTEWTPPLYAAPDAFTEHEQTVGADPEAVAATITLPRGDGPWPAAVLLAGSGPRDDRTEQAAQGPGLRVGEPRDRRRTL